MEPTIIKLPITIELEIQLKQPAESPRLNDLPDAWQAILSKATPIDLARKSARIAEERNELERALSRGGRLAQPQAWTPSSLGEVLFQSPALEAPAGSAVSSLPDPPEGWDTSWIPSGGCPCNKCLYTQQWRQAHKSDLQAQQLAAILQQDDIPF